MSIIRRVIIGIGRSLVIGFAIDVHFKGLGLQEGVAYGRILIVLVRQGFNELTEAGLDFVS